MEVGRVRAYRCWGLVGGSFDMVVMVEIVFLIVCAALGLWLFSRTSLFRAHVRSGADPAVKGRDFGYGPGSPRMTSAQVRMRPPPVRHYDDK
jgi:hypothetical protein